MSLEWLITAYQMEAGSLFLRDLMLSAVRGKTLRIPAVNQGLSVDASSKGGFRARLVHVVIGSSGTCVVLDAGEGEDELAGAGALFWQEYARRLSQDFAPVLPFAPEVPAQESVARDFALQVLKSRNDELTLEQEHLKSQLVAARRAELSASRQTEYLEAQNENLLRHIGTLAQANRDLQAALIAREAGRLRMHETHSGTVTDVEGDEVAVTYETDEGPLEQVYERSQFLDGQLPRVGDELEAHVIVTRRPTDASRTREGTRPKAQEDDELRAFREKGVSGPIEI